MSDLRHVANGQLESWRRLTNSRASECRFGRVLIMSTPSDADPCSPQRYRQYLLMLARVQVDADLHGKLDPSDLVQQTLLEAFEKRDQFRGETSGEMAAWLRQILAHNLADALRSLRRGKRDVAREQQLGQALDASSMRLEALLAAEQTSPSMHVARDEQAVELANALAQLPDAQREALVLQHWHGWPLKQIAEHLDRTPTAVAGLLKRGLKQLREIMKKP
jgi:RNA polymerase sigma-70 factor (ECF subfamily)